MDIIYECANNFKKLENTKYHFVFVQNRKKHDITLNFCLADFRHAAGLHHITDIVIENNLIKTMDAILRSDCNLTEYLTKGHSNVRPSVKRWEMTGNPVKSRVVANFIEKK